MSVGGAAAAHDTRVADGDELLAVAGPGAGSSQLFVVRDALPTVLVGRAVVVWSACECGDAGGIHNLGGGVR
jgi:hypothetical protein